MAYSNTINVNGKTYVKQFNTATNNYEYKPIAPKSGGLSFPIGTTNKTASTYATQISKLKPSIVPLSTLQRAVSTGGITPTQGSFNAPSSGGSNGGGGGGTPPPPPELAPKPAATSFSNLYNNVISTLLKPTSTVNASAMMSPTSGTNTSQNAFQNILQNISASPLVTGASNTLRDIWGSVSSVPKGSWGTPEFGITENLGPIVKGAFNDTVGKYGDALKYVSGLTAGMNKPTGVISPLPDNYSFKAAPSADLANRIKQSALNTGGQVLGANTGSTINKMGGELQTGFNNIDQQLLNQIDEIYNQYASGYMGEQEMQQKIADMQKTAANSIYDTLRSNYQSNIPLLENQFNTDKSFLEGLIPQQKEQSESAKSSTKNIYGAALRKIAGNTAQSNRQLGNIYSALGTADSSDFLNRQQQLLQASGSDIAATESEMAGKIADIDLNQQKFEDNIRYQINTLVNDIASKKQEVMNNINLSEAQRAGALTDINTSLASGLQSLAEKYQNARMQFDTMKYNAVQSSADLLKNYQVNESLYGRTLGYGAPKVDTELPGQSSTVSGYPKKKKIGGIDWILQFDPTSGIQYYQNPTNGQKYYLQGNQALNIA